MEPEPDHLTENITKLHHIHNILVNTPPYPEPHIKDYISLFVENHHTSEQYFTTFCQHDFLTVMIHAQQKAKMASPTCLLQCINLVLKNTRNCSELLYFLSQSIFHDYLFGFSITAQSSEFIEYYIQLLKTILLKINENQHNKSLIKMFCNSKYPSFPLLTNCTILAVDSNQLVRVTAQQCLLILVVMMNEKGIMRRYLLQFPLLFLFYRLCSEFNKKSADKEGIIKYLVDFSFQLRENQVPLLILNSIISNVIIIPSLPQSPTTALFFIYHFSNSLMAKISQQKIQKNISDTLQTICLIHYRVLIKYLTSKYINAVYLSTIFILSSFQPIQVQKLAFEKLITENNCKQFIEDGKVSYDIDINVVAKVVVEIEDFASGKEFQKIKQNYLKRNNPKNDGFFVSLFKKLTEQSSSQLVKFLPCYFGINFKGQGFPKNLNIQTAAFISEYMDLMFRISRGIKIDELKWNQDSQDCEAMQVHYNDYRSQWSLTGEFIRIIYFLTKEFLSFIHEENAKILKISTLYVPHYYPFLKQLKSYFNYSIHEHLSYGKRNQELLGNTENLKALRKICKRLKVIPKQQCMVCLGHELNIVHAQIQACVFEKGFKEVVQYILLNEIKSPINNDRIILRKIATFETIQQIMSPQISSLSKCFEKKWNEIRKNPQKQVIKTYMVTYFGKNESTLQFEQSFDPPTIFINIKVYGKSLSKINIMSLDHIRKNKIDNRVVQIGGSHEAIRMLSNGEADELVERFNECRFAIEEIATIAIIQYLSHSHQTLYKESKSFKPESSSTLEETPQ